MSSDLLDAVHRLSPDEYRRLVDAGVFDEDARLELIDGLVLDKGPRSPAHERAIELLATHLIRALDPARFRVRIAAPLSLEASEPEPDLAVIRRDVPDLHHPATAALVIEVAHSSQRADLRQKPSVYARAGVPLYVVVDLDAGRLVVHREPRDEAYAEVEQHGEDAQLDLGFVGAGSVALRELLAFARGGA